MFRHGKTKCANLHIQEIKATIRAFYFSFFPSPISVQRYKKSPGKEIAVFSFPEDIPAQNLTKTKYPRRAV